MRNALLAATVALLPACTCADPSPPPPVKPGKLVAKHMGADGKGAKAGGRKADAARRADGLVLRMAEFRIPVQSLGEGEGQALRDAVLAALAEVDEEPRLLDDDELSAWKCRTARAWRMGETGQLLLWERYPTPECTGEVERWWMDLDIWSPAAPTEKGAGGKLKFDTAGLTRTWTDDGWATAWYTRHDLVPSKTNGAFEEDDAFVADQMPEDAELVGGGTLVSERWSLAHIVVAGEKMFIEAERVRCEGSDDALGGVITFRTNRRLGGHTPQSPRDVVIVPKVQTFADAVVKQLGDRIGGASLSLDDLLTCAE